jgi:glyoxylase-like metal-dependent hydrolase (beta-lactamase superfamily II)
LSTGEQWTVTAVRYGTLRSTKAELFYRWSVYGDPDGPQSLDYFFYVLRDDSGRTILVDCGFHPDEGARRGRTCLVEPLDALARLGVSPEDVERIIISHLHYDHIGNLHEFPSANLVVPARELSFWTSPAAKHPHFSAHVDADDVNLVVDARSAGRVTEVSGVTNIDPGITVIEVGGHSPGQHMIVVKTASGPRILATDAIHLYEEAARRRPFAVVVDLEEMYKGYEVAEELARGDDNAIVVPGHDPLVAGRFPKLGGDLAEIGVQL